MSNDFAFLLTKHRKAAQFSMADLAQASGTVTSTIGLVERAQRSPPEESVTAWAKALGLTGDNLRIFLRAAQRARAYAQLDARAELDALNAEIEAFRSLFRVLVPLLNAAETVKAEMVAAFDGANILGSLRAVRALLRGN